MAYCIQSDIQECDVESDWDQMLSFITPSNYSQYVPSDPNFLTLADCLGKDVMSRYQTYIGVHPGIIEPSHIKLRSLLKIWQSTQRELENLPTKFIEKLEHQKDKKGVAELNLFITKLKETVLLEKCPISSLKSLDSEIEDTALLDTLKWWQIKHLYHKFRSQNVTLGVLWELDEDMLKDCKLNRVEKLQYKKAKEGHLNADKDLVSRKDYVDEIRLHFESELKKKDGEIEKLRKEVTVHFESKLRKKDDKIEKLSKEIRSLNTWHQQTWRPIVKDVLMFEGQVTLQWKDKYGKEGSVTSGKRISQGMTVWSNRGITLTQFPEILRNSILFKLPLGSIASLTLHTKIDVEIFVCSFNEHTSSTSLTALGYEKMNGKLSFSNDICMESIDYKKSKAGIETLQPENLGWIAFFINYKCCYLRTIK